MSHENELHAYFRLKAAAQGKRLGGAGRIWRRMQETMPVRLVAGLVLLGLGWGLLLGAWMPSRPLLAALAVLVFMGALLSFWTGTHEEDSR